MFYFFIIALTQNSSKYLCRFFCPYCLKHWGVNTVVLFRLHSFSCNRRRCIGRIAKTRPLNAVIFVSGFPQSGTLTCAYQTLLRLLVCVHKNVSCGQINLSMDNLCLSKQLELFYYNNRIFINNCFIIFHWPFLVCRREILAMPPYPHLELPRRLLKSFSCCILCCCCV